MLGAHQPAHAPSRGIEVLACGTDGECSFGDGGGEVRYAREGDVVEAIVDL